MRENGIKKAIREDRVAVGAVLNEFHTRGIAKLMEYAGLDWVMLDMEHSGWDLDRVANMIGWFAATSITVIVRPPDMHYHFLARLMDAGAMGIQAAHVETAAEAQALVDSIMYPPLGNRGVGLNAIHTEFLKPKAADYMPLRNAQTSIFAGIESVRGVENIEEIAAVEGIDVLSPSHNDLTVALGVPQQYDHPKYKAAMQRVGDAAKRYGKTMKLNPQNDETIAFGYALGCRVMGTKNPTILFQDAMRRDAQHLRERTEQLAAQASSVRG